jgi:hypothetical protein
MAFRFERAPTGKGQMDRVLSLLTQRLILAAALVAGMAYHAAAFLNHDVSFLLVATARWLNGATLYTDIMEINPPWVFYLTAPAVLLADDLGIGSSGAFVVWIGAIATLSLFWSWSLVSRVPGLGSWNAYAIVLACLASLIFIPSVNFGQREHIFVIFALPYLIQQMFFASSGLPTSRMESTALGVFAVMGIALKPFFLLPALILAYVRCRQSGSLKPAIEPANVAIALGCGAYVLFAAGLHPEYFSNVVPLGSLIYGSIGFQNTESAPDTIVPLLLIFAIVTVEDASSVLRNKFTVLAVALGGLLLAYALQYKGWRYQLLPFDCMALIACVVAVVTSSQSYKQRPLHFAIFAIVAATLLTRAAFHGRYDNGYATVFESKLQEVRADWKGRSVLLLSPDIFAAFPLINSLGAEWVGRYPYQWVIAGALSSQAREGCLATPASCPDLNKILEYARRTNVDDIVGQSPDVVIVDVRPIKPYFPIRNFDFIDFLKSDPRFDAKWREYRKLATEMSYDIWVRDSDRNAIAQGKR